MTTRFNRARYQVGRGFDFQAGTARWLLGNYGTWTPNVDDDFVQTALVAGATDPAGSGNRKAILNPTVTLDDVNDRAVWGADDFAYSGVPNGSVVNMLLLYNLVTNDSDSWLIAEWTITPVTGDGADISIHIPSSQLLAW